MNSAPVTRMGLPLEDRSSSHQDANRKDPKNRAPVSLPSRNPWKYRWFVGYARRYWKRHFHALRLSRASAPLPPADAGPLILYLNHASWWDPLTCLIVGDELLSDRIPYAPIDSAQLQRYWVFQNLGFFGVQKDSLLSLRKFISVGAHILSQPNRVLWMTPQGAFADVRQRPVVIQPGLTLLLNAVPSAWVVPLAVEYVFWNDRLPEGLLRCGAAMRASEVLEWGSCEEQSLRLSQALAETQDALASESMRREPSLFETLTEGGRGVAAGYDAWQRLRCWWTGKRYEPDHDAGGRAYGG